MRTLTHKQGRIAAFGVANLRDALAGKPPQATYHPRRHSLYLMNTGDGAAILSYGPFSAEGRWVLHSQSEHIADLIGLPAVSTEGEALGTCIAVDNFGAGDVLEIQRPGIEGKPGKKFMVPMRAEAVPEWDGERLVITAAFAAED